jgi:hypothetical protein
VRFSPLLLVIALLGMFGLDLLFLYVSCYVGFYLSPLLVLPVLFGIESPLFLLWYREMNTREKPILTGYKLRDPKKVFEEYCEMSIKSGRHSKERTAT